VKEAYTSSTKAGFGHDSITLLSSQLSPFEDIYRVIAKIVIIHKYMGPITGP